MVDHLAFCAETKIAFLWKRRSKGEKTLEKEISNLSGRGPVRNEKRELVSGWAREGTSKLLSKAS